MNIDLDAIQIRDELATKGVRGIETKDQIIADREALLALVRDLEARLAVAWDEGYTTGNAHNGRRDANPYRAALTASDAS